MTPVKGRRVESKVIFRVAMLMVCTVCMYVCMYVCMCGDGIDGRTLDR